MRVEYLQKQVPGRWNHLLLALTSKGDISELSHWFPVSSDPGRQWVLPEGIPAPSPQLLCQVRVGFQPAHCQLESSLK